MTMLNICSFYRAFASVEAEGTTGGAGLCIERPQGELAGRIGMGLWEHGRWESSR